MAGIDSIDVQNKRVLVRVDFNVPQNDEYQITDDSRIRAHLPTIEYLLSRGARVVLMAHLGRPQGKRDPQYSLAPVAEHLEHLLEVPVHFSENTIGEDVLQQTNDLSSGEILLLENLRFHKGETEGDLDFARQLAANGDIYVNDAFGAAHRSHASTATIAQYFSGCRCLGLLMEAELSNARKLLTGGFHPLTAIVGGAKVSSKIGVLENLLERVDSFIIGGGMAFTFIKAQGGEIGSSLVEDEYLDTAGSFLAKAQAAGAKVYLPSDVLAADRFANDAETDIYPADKIPQGWMGLDAGPETLAEIQLVLARAKAILWNGPMGVFELQNFAAGTQQVGSWVADCTREGAFTLVGGGDSVAALKSFGLEDQVSFVSTGGGALLEFLEGKTLPGIAAMDA